MRRVIMGLVLAAVVAPLAHAGSSTSKAELAGPQPKPEKIVIDGRVWSCEGTSCVATGEGRSQSVARECWRAARKLGPFVAYSRDGVALDATALKACNAQ